MANDYLDWLTKDYVAECLNHEAEFSDINIVDFKVSPAVPAGNNFGSNIIRVNLKFTIGDQVEDKSLSLIIKTPLTGGALGELVNVDCEPVFYNEFLSHANKLLKHKFAPKSFYLPVPSVVIMEDLTSHKFSMTDRVKQLDFEHCKLYMTAAASLHAVSFAFYKENPELINRIGFQKMFNNNLKSDKLFKDVNKYALLSLANKIKSKEQAEIVKSCSFALWDLLVDAHKPSTFFNCLTQGDPWTTNMMFKYHEDGHVCDIKLLDFQIIAYGSPAHDIVFFLWSSANHDVRKNKINDLYHIYLDALNQNLKSMNCSESLSYDQFMVDVTKMNSLALWATGWVPCLLRPSPADIEAICAAVRQGGDSLKENPYDQYYTESYNETHLEQTMEELEHHGVFKYLADHLKAN